ncbi:TetR/AcrR family transcriptional regulator [Aquimarina mytili]|uniref:TetR family transcriptional regulator n=1 Tax=Aquimarina mytili TaxID=874423 RepID=A0A936ZPG0_9FLAO|nr:TetR/AcrR family transcriptional regulator [Aquimarina mytili]MBL0681907.1 TetR family transcriptional regulator [Aquimarina mytili]
MSNTKSEIIRHAVLLFNKKGFFNVSIKDIADAMKISPGNLTYHFKKKEHLLSAIQDEILSSSVDIMPKGRYITLDHFEEMFSRFYNVQQRYSFFFLDISYLIVEYPSILDVYKVATKKRFSEARKLVDHFIATDRLLAENDRIDYDVVIHNLWMVSTFWTTSTMLIDKKKSALLNNSPIDALWGILSPYLTTKGFDEYQEIIHFSKENTNTNSKK